MAIHRKTTTTAKVKTKPPTFRLRCRTKRLLGWEVLVIQRLTAIVRRYNRQVLLAPYPGMDKTIALTAWTRIDKFDAFDERRIVRFIEAYRGIDHHTRNVFQQ